MEEVDLWDHSLKKSTLAARDNMEGTLVSSSLVYGNMNEGNISSAQEDPMFLATSYMVYKIGEISCLIFCLILYKNLLF